MEKLLGLLEKEMNSVREFRDVTIDQISEIMTSLGDWKRSVEKFETMQTNFLEQARKLALQEKKLVEDSDLLRQREKEVEVKIKRFEECSDEFERKEKELELIKIRIQDSSAELNSREEQLNECNKELSSKKQELHECDKELSLKIQELEEFNNKVLSKKKDLSEVQKSLEKRTAELESEGRNLGFVKKKIRQYSEKLSASQVKLESVKKSLQEHFKKLEHKEKELGEVEDLISIKKNELEDNEKQFDCSHCNPACSSFRNSHFSACASEKSPELLLHNIVNDPNLTIDEVSNGLQFSPDPAKRVLDVMRETYFQFQNNGSAGFDYCRNVVLLLELLMKMAPNVSLQVKQIALQQGLLWKENINSETQNSVEILAFLMFVAAYDLASNFRRDEILVLVRNIVHYKQAPEICRALCFIDEIASLTANLIQSKQFAEAARFSKAFELSSKFLPQNILRNYLETIKMGALVSVYGSNSFQEQFKITDKESLALKTFWECVVDCQLESVFPLESCRQYVAGLKAAHSSFDSPYMSQQPQERGMACMVSGSNPSRRPFHGTGKRPRLDSRVSETHQGSILPQYGDQGGYFAAKFLEMYGQY